MFVLQPISLPRWFANWSEVLQTLRRRHSCAGQHPNRGERQAWSSVAGKADGSLSSLRWLEYGPHLSLNQLCARVQEQTRLQVCIMNKTFVSNKTVFCGVTIAAYKPLSSLLTCRQINLLFDNFSDISFFNNLATLVAGQWVQCPSQPYWITILHSQSINFSILPHELKWLQHWGSSLTGSTWMQCTCSSRRHLLLRGDKYHTSQHLTLEGY